MTAKTFAIETLGCKVNQYESSYLVERLTGSGLIQVAFQQKADLYVVNSCAVTSRAAVQGRQLLRRAARLNPAALIVLAGCEAQAESDRIESEALATHILGNVEKLDLLRILGEPGSRAAPFVAVGNPRECSSLSDLPIHSMQSGRARAFQKVQDGCDSFCSYCIVPFTRGKSRSVPPEKAAAQMARFVEAGYDEVVLTGIHLGQWGRDLAPGNKLHDLLKAVEQVRGKARLRLSSLEPNEWSQEFIESIRSRGWVCPHFHVPLQSGDPEILKRMARPYTPSQYEELVNRLAEASPGCAIGADVMVGFPGETAASFGRTMELIERLPLSYLHVFPYSPRPGTRAAAMGGRISGAELRAMTGALRKLGELKRGLFASGWVGQTLDVLVESKSKTGWMEGTSQNYLHIRFSPRASVSHRGIVRVRVEAVTSSGINGTLLT